MCPLFCLALSVAASGFCFICSDLLHIYVCLFYHCVASSFPICSFLLSIFVAGQSEFYFYI
uniref:Uncharacterized protein n=1 Tax=Rhizophora mucronata TaxID=61149 RepID=A0A2P2LL77_RHIMU